MFRAASIWDIPLVKPRFGCAASMSLALQGYDVASALNTLVASTVEWGCESGFLALEPTQLAPKADVEFGVAANKPEPDISGLRVSVMYTVTRSDAGMFRATLPTMLEYFPGALEVRCFSRRGEGGGGGCLISVKCWFSVMMVRLTRLCSLFRWLVIACFGITNSARYWLVLFFISVQAVFFFTLHMR